MSTLLKTINLEIQMDDRGEEHRSEKGVDALFTLRNNLNTIQGMFKKAEDEFDLPTIGIQDNDLKCRDIRSVRDQAIGRGADCTFDQAEEDARCIGMRRLDNPITYVCPMSGHMLWQRYW